jgi:hypothetical protein
MAGMLKFRKALICKYVFLMYGFVDATCELLYGHRKLLCYILSYNALNYRLKFTMKEHIYIISTFCICTNASLSCAVAHYSTICFKISACNSYWSN